MHRILLTLVVLFIAAAELSAQCGQGPINGNRIGQRTRIHDPGNLCDCGDNYTGPWTLQLLESGQPSLRLTSNGGLQQGDEPCEDGVFGTLSLHRGITKYSDEEGINDLSLVAGPLASNLILATRGSNARIIFSVAPGTSGIDDEKMTILGNNHVGIGTSTPQEYLQIGTKSVYHVGFNNDYLGYNIYTGPPPTGTLTRHANGYSSRLDFGSNGAVRLELGGTGTAASTPSFSEASGSYRALSMFYNGDGNAIFAFGREWPVGATRLSVNGLGTTSSTNSLQLMNASGAQTFLVNDAGNAIVGTGTPVERFQIGDLMMFHDGGGKSFNFNAYYNGTSNVNVTAGRISAQIGVSESSGNPQRFFISVDENASGGGTVFNNYHVLGTFKGLAIDKNGMVGIAVPFPAARLAIRSSGTSSSTNALTVDNSSGTNMLTLRDDGNMGIGNVTASARLTVKGSGSSSSSRAVKVTNSTGAHSFSVRDDGKVIIGTSEDGIGSGTHANFRLAVDGKVVAKSVVCTETGWADDVFEPGYSLMSLDDLDTFIRQNGHLPGVPTTEQVEKDGVNIPDAVVTLLRKVEELTLYMLELKRENDALRSTK